MFKRLGRMLKRGAMSVEYIVIGVCVIGMAALATTFVSGKMTEAMGKEIDSGDTNTGGQDSNNGSNSNLSTCDTNKFFYDKYGLYPGTYDFIIPNGSQDEYKSEINSNGICIFERYWLVNNNRVLIDCHHIDLNSSEVIKKEYSSDGSGTIRYNITGTLLKLDMAYFEKDLGYNQVLSLSKEITIYYKMKSGNEQSYVLSYLPKEAFKLDGHEDCSGFRTDKQDFCTSNEFEHGKFVANKDENQSLIISENRIEYNDSTSNIHLVCDFENEIVYDVNTGSSAIIASVLKHAYNIQINFFYKDSGDDQFLISYIDISPSHSVTVRPYIP